MDQHIMDQHQPVAFLAFDPYKLGQYLSLDFKKNSYKSPYYMSKVSSYMEAPRNLTAEEIDQLQKGLFSKSAPGLALAMMFGYIDKVLTISVFSHDTLKLPDIKKNMIKDKFTCSKCFTNHGSSICQGCKVVRYCGKSCQRADWETHRKVCYSKISKSG